MSVQGNCRVTKRAFVLVPIINTIVGAIEERVFNLFNHLSNEPILQLNICVDLSPQNCQPLELFNVIA